MDDGEDRLSNLPKDILVRILDFLPTKEVLRTTVLSTIWRNIWRSIAHLDFENQREDNFIDYVHEIVRLHQGSLRRFQLSCSILPPSDTIDELLFMLSSKNIETLVLKFQFDSPIPYRLPHCFFSQDRLTTLVLRGCVLEPPAEFSGLKILQNLSLQNCKLTYPFLMSFLSRCPGISSLSIELIQGLNIKGVCLMNQLTEFNVYEVSHSNDLTELPPMLSYVADTVPPSDIGILEVSVSETCTSTYLLFIMGAIPNVQKLVAKHWLMEAMDEDDISFPGELTNKFTRLHTLSLEIDLGSFYDVQTALHIFDNSPNLETLEICIVREEDVANFDVDALWNHVVTVGCNMSQLKVLTLKIMGGELDAELRFIGFVLSSTPMLKDVLVVYSDHSELGLYGLLPIMALIESVSPRVQLHVQFEDDQYEGDDQE